ncbi:uncharacterized protein EV420DRAFT_1270055 [Desarmillaria tabescens]|uniref:Uncharacterized protein n=1 Tax=Armillaria tabescens TaxID=1929756 RepID=A0AA39KF47_ARMTA|nr:uncharacterized protein EV420DRAFT_1270055 [Desarmillaria tabescens]KAK0458741.1 hypothetical protein EV420DRAFT_1270055 [Desarmillaria tabescens]
MSLTIPSFLEPNLNGASKYRDETTGTLDLGAFKVMYVAPMKVSDQGMVTLSKVGELTDDSHGGPTYCRI